MSLGTDQGSLMSTELPWVAERAQHDPESGGRHPGVFTSDPDQGVVLGGRCFAPAACDGASAILPPKGIHDALVRWLLRFSPENGRSGPRALRDCFNGGAEWWKSPCSDLRGLGRATARATRPVTVDIRLARCACGPHLDRAVESQIRYVSHLRTLGGKWR